MNIRLFTVALLASAIPLAVSAGKKEISLDKSDFIAAEKIAEDGEAIVKLKLSKSGKAKLKKLNEQKVGQEVHTEIGGVSSDFQLRVPITGDGLEMGPYSESDAKKVVTAINRN